ncbi:MAG: hypothetical protein JWN70_1785, partial [Planctomycetaceae bacterium]|nr:hypothetical protein [Planctomycetaceae bacterium]
SSLWDLAAETTPYVPSSEIPRYTSNGHNGYVFPQMNLCLVFMRVEVANLATIRQPLDAYGYRIEQRSDSELIIESSGGPECLYGVLVTDECTSDLALRLTESKRSYRESLQQCGAYFAIQFDNLDEVLARPYRLNDVQSKILSATGGIMYSFWDHSVIRADTRR